MNVKTEIERVIEVFGAYIDSIPVIDIAYSRKGRVIYLEKGLEAEDIETAEWLCDRLLSEIEFDVQKALNLDGKAVPKEQRWMLIERMKPYMDKLPEYQHLLEQYR